MAGIGDIDGDGLDDWMVGAPAADLGNSAAGQVYLISGDQTGTIDLAQTPRQSFMAVRRETILDGRLRA